MATQVRDQLLASNDEFRRLADEHSQYSQRLDNLIQKKYLSEDEKLEEVRLKKLKLRLKDQMESLEQQFRTGHPVVYSASSLFSQYSQRLDNLIQKKYLSEDEKLEEVRLKKLKLRLKDQMESLEHKRSEEHT